MAAICCPGSIWIGWAAILLMGRIAAADPLPKPPAAAAAGREAAQDVSPLEMIVRLQDGGEAQAFAAAHGLELGGGFRSDPRLVLLRAPTPQAAAVAAQAIQADPRATWLGTNAATAHRRFGPAFVPDDPYFPRNTPTTGRPGQWHLVNAQTPGRDARVQQSWNAGWTGSGVVIGIVDDGLQVAHPDLAPNHVASLAYDFGQNDSDPSPVAAGDNHGTSVAGVAAARGGNGIGVTGAAPQAGLAGLRIDFDNQTTAMFVDATLYKSSGTDTSITIKNHSYGVAVPYAPSPAERTALATSAAAGTIHVFAAGNERGGQIGWDADANKKQAQASPDVITVAAFGSDGTWASYSNYGANVFVTAPSSSSKGITGITTTDRTGTAGYNPAQDSYPDTNYTGVFGGTSSAAPLVAGALALVKQAQPALDGRFAKHLLARTSDVVDAADATVSGGGDGATAGSAWKTNAAGFAFNMNYGFGLVDAAGMTALAPLYSGVTPLESHSTGTLAVGQAIPEQGSLVRTVGVNLAAPPPLEEVLVSLAATHTYRGDLSAVLTSPSGTASRLMLENGQDAADNLSWTFTSNAFWGESPNGTWSLELFDRLADDTGTWQSWDMTLRMGTLVAVPEPATLALAAAGLACFGWLRRRRGRLAAALPGLLVAVLGSTAMAQGQGPPPWVQQPGRGAPPARVFDRSLSRTAVSGDRRLPPRAQALGVPAAQVLGPARGSGPVFRSGSLQAAAAATGLAEAPPSSGAATTGVGGGTFNLNTFLGADRYYDHTTPITGQNTITFNLEAGHFWNGHETLQHVATNSTNFVNSGDTWGLNPGQRGTIPPLYDRHATWAAMLVGGRQTAVNPQLRQQGLAPGTDLRSAALATAWASPAYALAFGISADSAIAGYTGSFGTAHVVNSSYGYEDSGGTDPFTVFSDAMSFQSPGTLHVVSAGNEGPSANTVGAPGSGYNTLVVAALGSPDSFDTVAGFSSRGPQDFAYYSADEIVTVPGVRAPVDLAAPGTSLTSAFYGGQTGGNNPSLDGSTDQGSDADAYSASINGTSFAAPIVAGGAALMASAARTLPGLAENPDAAQSVVVKALLMTGADKPSGWSNGQQQVTVGSETFLRTTQSLDWAAGAGRMNLATTFDLQVNGQPDVTGTDAGSQGAVVKTGWDYGASIRGTSNDYMISDWLRGGTTFTTTLTWMRAREWDSATGNLFEIAQADLNLSVWELDGNNTLTTLIARSESLYDTAEHLSFTLPRSGFFGLRVEYPLNTFDNTTEQVWGTAALPQDYGLAWHAVPEPGAIFLAVAGSGTLVWGMQRRLPPG